MPFQKGNTYGAKGAKTRAYRSKAWDELGAALLGAHTERVHQILNDAEDPVFIAGYMELLKYFKPKLASATITAGKQSVPIAGVSIAGILPAKSNGTDIDIAEVIPIEEVTTIEVTSIEPLPNEIENDSNITVTAEAT